ncbi:hypothetical protein JCM10450v2_007799 [Rhodotorula kratochvilovae]
MALHHPQPRSPAAFTFPSSSSRASSSGRDSHRQPPSLAAAFDYPVRADSLAHQATHAPQASTSSTASGSSRSRSGSSARDGDGYSTTRSAASSTYTAFTSDSYGYDDACDDGYSDAGSVLDDLYRDFASSPPSRPPTRDSPPRFHKHSTSTDSTMQLRERTRYRSSASLMPAAAGGAPHHHLAGAFGGLSLAPRSSAQAAPDSHMALLAALAATSSTLDRCFCGGEPEEDSIYCSRACAQADALNALCGASSSAEDAASSSDAASLRSGSSGGSGNGSGGTDSHYRRVEREETRRAKERERALRREEKERKARAAERERAEVDGARSLWRSEGDVGAARRPSQERIAPPPRTSSRRTPSLSSSISSLASSAAPSPISPSFPPHSSGASSPFIVEPPTPASLSFPDHVHPHALNAVAEERAPSPLLRPCTPNPRLHPAHSGAGGALDAGDIYASYLLATPQAGDKLRTPTQHPSGGVQDACNSTPRAAFPHTPGGEDDDDDESPTQRGGGAAAGVGLRMLELCGSDDEGGDEVAPLRGGGHRRAAPLGGGHTKGKLSFDDVVGILSA